jgi:thioredoxin-related protein
MVSRVGGKSEGKATMGRHGDTRDDKRVSRLGTGVRRPWFAAWLLAALCAAFTARVGAASASQLDLAQDLAREAAEAQATGRVLVVLYGTQSCPYCRKIRQSYLGPLARNLQAQARMVIREIDVESGARLIDFAGAVTTHSAYARAQRVRLVPVVAFYGSEGKVLAEPLVGLSSEDFYGAYLEERLATAQARIRAAAD